MDMCRGRLGIKVKGLMAGREGENTVIEEEKFLGETLYISEPVCSLQVKNNRTHHSQAGCVCMISTGPFHYRLFGW